MRTKIIDIVLKIIRARSKKSVLDFRTDQSAILAAKILINQIKSQGVLESIQQAEFKVFSQFGDDGIIQYLIHHLQIDFPAFIEFGIKSYIESNTRFLLENNNWKGLIIDGGQAHIEAIKHSSMYWRHDLRAVSAFLDKKNVNSVFREHHFMGDIGILSIDIDGNDYWIWEAIDVVNPILVIIEYNSLFGKNYAVTIPYDPQFIYTNAHYSHLYFGASLKALCLLADKKGYYFVGSNSAGNNAYFVRKDKIGQLKIVSAEEGYVKSKFRISRNQQGELNYLSWNECLQVIREMPVYDIEREVRVKIKELFSEN